MRSESTLCSLEDCLDVLLDYRGKTPKKTISGIPLVTAKVVKAGRIETPTEFIAADDYDSWMTRGMPKVGDVVMTTEAPLGEVGQIQTLPVALAQRIVTLRGKEGILHNDYLLYALQSSHVQAQLKGRASGTTVVGIKQSELRKISLELPPYALQVEIASILKSLDDRIDLLRQTNENLELITQTLFKSWFIDFDPVRAKAEGREPEGMDAATASLFPAELEESALGLIPKGWRLAGVGEIAEVIDCLHSKKPQLRDEGRPYLQLSNIRDDGLLNASALAFISDSDYATWTSRIEVREGDCIITNVGRVGAVSQVPPRLLAAMGRNMTAIRLRPEYPYPSFLIELLLSKWMRVEIERRTDIGTILNALNVRSIPLLRFVMAPHEVFLAAEKILRPLRASMESNMSRVGQLAMLRDTLLPRLISGRLRLPEAQEQRDEALA